MIELKIAIYILGGGFQLKINLKKFNIPRTFGRPHSLQIGREFTGNLQSSAEPFGEPLPD
jgi:hypothetical protein